MMKDLLGEENGGLLGERERDRRGLALVLRGEVCRTSGEEGRVRGSADVEAVESSMVSSRVIRSYWALRDILGAVECADAGGC